MLCRYEVRLLVEFEVGVECLSVYEMRPGLHGVFSRAVGPDNTEGKGAELGERTFMTDDFIDEIKIFV
jgi:hypothetical protein